MTQTTTAVNACDVGLWLDNASGTPIDIGGSSNECSLKLSQNIGEIPTFGTDWPRRKACGRDCKASLKVIYSTATDEALDLLKDWFFGANHKNARTLTVYIPDKNVGSDVYQGEFVLESLDVPVQAGDGKPILVSAELSVDGALINFTNAT